MNGPGVAFECQEKDGLHIWIDHYLVEVIDPETGEVLGEGEKGELILTPLTKEALPLLRYRTGDLTFLVADGCACGRTHPRIHRILGRTDDMIVVRGINVFPSQIEHVLMGIPELGEHFQIIVTRNGSLDELLVRVEMNSFESADASRIRRSVAEELKKELGLRVDVELVEKGTLERFEGKARRVIDLRKEV
jgi:phenylacetate-CoA ligase